MRTSTVKDGLQLFGVVAVGTSVFGLWQGYRIGETLIAAVILSAFVVGIVGGGADGSGVKSQIDSSVAAQKTLYDNTPLPSPLVCRGNRRLFHRPRPQRTGARLCLFRR